jgi:uncharacterized protein (DUF1330 family)/ketosteroid isomerase-like protein
MAAYVISDVRKRDVAGFERYRSIAQAAIARHGGRYLVRGGEVRSVEGDWAPEAIVVVEFPSMERAQAWYRSPEYAAALQVRPAALDRNLIFVEGSAAGQHEEERMPVSSEHPVQAPVTGSEAAPPTTPLGALAEFYRAFNGRDLALMEQNWDPSPEAVMDNPLGGILRGWPAIREVYQRLFSGGARVTVEFFDYTLHGADDVFWAIGRERGMLQQAGRPDLPLLIRTSRLFRRGGDGRWRQAHHHGSIDDPKLLAEYQARVRGPAADA